MVFFERRRLFRVNILLMIMVHGHGHDICTISCTALQY
jgi:hypothetical protein